MNTIEEYKNAIEDLVKEFYAKCHKDWIPIFPNVLVFVLPREQKVGSIWTPVGDKNQNKVTLEGVVLKTWEPWHKTYLEESGCCHCGTSKDHHYTSVEGHSYVENYYSIREPIVSNLMPGDHILFPHYSGWPVSKETDKYFRFVKEYSSRDLTIADECIVGKVNHEFGDKQIKLIQDLRRIMRNKTPIAEIVDILMANYLIHPKESVTLSGK